MSREKGVIGISGAFEAQSAMPLDARMIVSEKADLILPATWTANDGSIYAYLGMVVSVHSDITPDNNGLYRLAAMPYTVESNWKFIGTSDDIGTKQYVWNADETPYFDDFVTGTTISTYIYDYPTLIVDIKLVGTGHIISTDTYSSIIAVSKFIGNKSASSTITIPSGTIITRTPYILDAVRLELYNDDGTNGSIDIARNMNYNMYLVNGASLACQAGAIGIRLIPAGPIGVGARLTIEMGRDCSFDIYSSGELINIPSGLRTGVLTLKSFENAEINSNQIYGVGNINYYYTDESIDVGSFGNYGGSVVVNKMSDSNRAKYNTNFVLDAGATFEQFYFKYNIEEIDYPFTIRVKDNEGLQINSEIKTGIYQNLDLCTIIGATNNTRKTIVQINDAARFSGALPHFEDCEIAFTGSQQICAINTRRNWTLKNCIVLNTYSGGIAPIFIDNSGELIINLENTKIYRDEGRIFEVIHNNANTVFNLFNSSLVDADAMFEASPFSLSTKVTFNYDSNSSVGHQTVGGQVNNLIDKAINQFYDNSTSLLISENVNDAIDELSNFRYKRIDVDSIPIASVYFPFSLTTSFIEKWFPKIQIYFNWFLFEIYQEGIGIVGTDLQFGDLSELETWINDNCTESITTIIKCYYYEDQKRGSTNALTAHNFGYRLISSGKYANTMSKVYYDSKWGGRNLFIKDIYNSFLGIDSTGNELEFAKAIWFATNKKKLYNHHRDDLTPPTYIEIQNTISNNRSVFDISGNLYNVLSLSAGTKMEIIDSKFYGFNKTVFPATFEIIPNNTKPINFIKNYTSIIKIYLLKDPVSEYYAFYIKPVGVDNFIINGISDDIPNVIIGVSKGKAQTTYQSINTMNYLNLGINDILAVFNKDDSLLRALSGSYYSNYLFNPTKSDGNKVSFICGYGNGVFSKPTNEIKFLSYKRGVSLQIVF